MILIWSLLFQSEFTMKTIKLERDEKNVIQESNVQASAEYLLQHVILGIYETLWALWTETALSLIQ